MNIEKKDMAEWDWRTERIKPLNVGRVIRMDLEQSKIII
jgi:hypothetical protein